MFIDPPYNTGSAFEHYEDGLEHSIWLGLMRDRLEIIKKLLADEGSLWITIDDNEAHYLKVICDEIFGRINFVANLAWHKRVSPANDAKYFSADFDHVLVYALNKERWRPNRLDRTGEQLSYYKNPDNDSRGPWNSSAYTCAKSAGERPNLYYPITNPNTNQVIWPSKTRVWAYDPTTHQKNVDQGLIYWGKDGRGTMPRIKKFLDQTRKIVPRSIWSHEDAGHNQESKLETEKLFPGDPFATPKPERLLRRVLEIATNSGDLVLDSFAGSGTTGAVAHKMGRHWILVEVGDHASTHIVSRLRKVIDGEDEGGVTSATGWKGGGAFRYYELAPSLLQKDKWDREVINRAYKPEMIEEALCKLEGFTYAPSDDVYWQHGHSTEQDFIYVTRQALGPQQLATLSDEVGEGRSLLVLCTAYAGNTDAFPNLTVRKIPNHIRARCEWGHDDYSLNVANLPAASPAPPQGQLFDDAEEGE